MAIECCCFAGYVNHKQCISFKRFDTEGGDASQTEPEEVTAQGHAQETEGSYETNRGETLVPNTESSEIFQGTYYPSEDGAPTERLQCHTEETDAPLSGE